MNNEQVTLEAIQKIVYSSADDIVVATYRSFERTEERIEALENRLTARIAELESKMLDND
jgi:uncharacterized coiled-coil protein SlyX